MASETLGMTSSECARQLGVSVATLLVWVRQGKVPAIRLGGRKLIFSRKEIERVLSGEKPPTGGSPAAG